jgi:hypothetical protein
LWKIKVLCVGINLFSDAQDLLDSVPHRVVEHDMMQFLQERNGGDQRESEDSVHALDRQRRSLLVDSVSGHLIKVLIYG